MEVLSAHNQQMRLSLVLTVLLDSFVSESVAETSSPLRNYRHHTWSSFGVVRFPETISLTDSRGK